MCGFILTLKNSGCDMNKVLPTPTDQCINDPVTKGSVTPTLKSAEKVIECRTPAPFCTDVDTQEVDSSGNSTPIQPAKQAKHTH